MVHFPLSRDSHHTWRALSALVVLVLVLGVAGGFAGVIGGGLLLVVWWRLPPEYTFVAGQFALIGVGSGGFMSGRGTRLTTAPELGLLVLGEVSLIVLLLTPLATDTPRSLPVRLRHGGVTLFTIAVGVGASWALLQWVDALWLVGVALAGGGIVLAYSVHRYERWSLGELEVTE